MNQLNDLCLYVCEMSDSKEKKTDKECVSCQTCDLNVTTNYTPVGDAPS